MKHLQEYPDLSPIFESKKQLFERKPLAYSLSSLAPIIDKDTMDEHFNVHYAGYTKKLNEAVAEENVDVFMGPDMQGIKKILKNVSKYTPKVRNNGGGFYNHFLYFENMTPEKKTPKGKIKEAIAKNFGSLPKFKKAFLDAGINQFGSGWVWLVQNGNKLDILTTPNQDNPIMNRSFTGEILLGMDVWEHAYYLKHKADRKSYIGDFFEVIDWDVVEQRMK